MHRTLKRETTRPPRPSLQSQQVAFNTFRRVFNEEQPHQALGQRTPASLYRPSEWPLPKRPAPLSYPPHFEVRWTSQLGQIRWRNRFVFVSCNIRYQPLGLEEIGPALWAVFYGPVHLGCLDEADFRIMDGRGPRRRR